LFLFFNIKIQTDQEKYKEKMTCKSILVVTLSILAALAAYVAIKVDMNLVLMRFFRDVARANARKRLYGNEYAVMPIFLGNEEPIPIKSADDLSAEEFMTMTAEELEEYDGLDGGPLYIAIKGRVYDVTAKPGFYGEDGKYYLFVGKDATHSFATGCLDETEECLNSSTEGLTDAELKEVDRWVELYETHDQYTFVGFLVEDPVNKILEADEVEEVKAEDPEEEDQEEVEYV
jgi:predicted heme/steroid binding protein